MFAKWPDPRRNGPKPRDPVPGRVSCSWAVRHRRKPFRWGNILSSWFVSKVLASWVSFTENVFGRPELARGDVGEIVYGVGLERMEVLCPESLVVETRLSGVRPGLGAEGVPRVKAVDPVLLALDHEAPDILRIGTNPVQCRSTANRHRRPTGFLTRPGGLPFGRAELAFQAGNPGV